MSSTATNSGANVNPSDSSSDLSTPEKKRNLWKSLPPILTAIAAVIGSLTALITSISTIPVFQSSPEKAQVRAVTPEDLTKGVWFSEKGFYVNSAADFRFKFDGEFISGRYNNPGADAQIYQGSISYDLNGHMVVNAYWTENGSLRQCQEKKNNTYFWGHLQLTFSSKASMVGRWGYCNDEPDNSFSAVLN